MTKSKRVLQAALCMAAVLVLVLALPVAALVAGFALPAQYGATYYGALAGMTEKLYGAEGKKIVVIGTSSVPFGVDSALMQHLLAEGGQEYAVCNFGLYGTMGVKVMLDLAEDAIGEGDIVVFAPEIGSQTMSLFFSAREVWRAMDGHFGMLSRLGDNASELVGGFLEFASEKASFYRDGAPQGSGIYASASFNENGDLKNYSRPENVMPGGVDENGAIAFWEPDAAFVSYVNAYCARVREKGAEMYFSFCPMNEAALSDPSPEGLDAYYDRLSDLFDLKMLGDPADSVMEREWFYDTNFHLNEAGMTVHTVRLVEALKAALGDSSPTDVELPAMPPLPAEELPSGEGDVSDADCFTYAEGAGGRLVTGLTPSGAARTSLVLPYSYAGQPVVGFTADAFAGNTVLRELTLQEPVRSIPDGAFDGCTALAKLHVLQRDASRISVGFEPLRGAPSCVVYVPAGSLSSYMSDYEWQYLWSDGKVKESA